MQNARFVGFGKLGKCAKLVQHAIACLDENGQTAAVFQIPNPATMTRTLNDLVLAVAVAYLLWTFLVSNGEADTLWTFLASNGKAGTLSTQKSLTACANRVYIEGFDTSRMPINRERVRVDGCFVAHERLRGCHFDERSRRAFIGRFLEGVGKVLSSMPDERAECDCSILAGKDRQTPAIFQIEPLVHAGAYDNAFAMLTAVAAYLEYCIYSEEVGSNKVEGHVLRSTLSNKNDAMRSWHLRLTDEMFILQSVDASEQWREFLVACKMENLVETADWTWYHDEHWPEDRRVSLNLHGQRVADCGTAFASLLVHCGTMIAGKVGEEPADEDRGPDCVSGCRAVE